MKLPKNILDEIEARSDIVDVVGSYVTLQRAGSNLRGLCPFHSEKTPSFIVYPASNSFYCFGCGAGGGVFTFIMKAENLDFVGAAELLAARAGIRLPQEGYREDGDHSISRKRVYEVNLAAAKYFRACLFDPAIGSEAMNYLAGERRLAGSVIKHFGLGYAPNSFSAFGEYMRAQGFSEDELVQSDLLTRSDRAKRPYARFRNRVMFPIIDTSGNIIGFGGRVMDDSKPKYLNSSDTPGFKKSRNLFALNFAKSNCAESLILCEGYMDVIALHAAGFENAVATLGTAITQEQARIIARYTKRVVLIYDSDEAGRKADERAMRLLGEVGVEVRILKLKGAKDPDEFIRNFGSTRFAQELRGSRSGFQHKLDTILAKYDLTDPEGRIRATREVCELIAASGSSVEREVYIAAAAERLALTVDSIRNDVERVRRRLYNELRQRQSRDAVSAAKHYGDTINLDAAKNVAASGAEDVILGLLLLFDEYRTAVASGTVRLDGEDFFTAFGRRVFDEICRLQRSDEGYSRALLYQEFSADEQGRLQQLEQARSQLSDNSLQVLREAAETLKGERRLREAESAGDKLAAIRLKRVNNSKNKK